MSRARGAVRNSLLVSHGAHFIENSAQEGGGISLGGFYQAGPDALIMASVFEGNSAIHGGGVHTTPDNRSGAVVTVLRSLFTENVASSTGGAVAHRNGFGGLMEIQWGRYEGNTAESGGAVATGSYANRLEVQAAEFVGNRATQDGGAIAFGGSSNLFAPVSAELSIAETRLLANEAGMRGGGVHVGTDIFDSSIAPIAITGSRFEGNLALGGGAVSVLGNREVRVSYGEWVENQAMIGSGLLLGSNAARARVENSTVTGGSAFLGGGLASAASAESRLVHATVARNAAFTGSQVFGGVLRPEASVLSNSETGSDCASAAVISLGENADSDGSCHLFAPGDLPAQGVLPFAPVVQAFGLVALAPLPWSPLISHIPPACALADDQLGNLRPTGPGCEPGSVEVLLGGVEGGLPPASTPLEVCDWSGADAQLCAAAFAGTLDLADGNRDGVPDALEGLWAQLTGEGGA